MEVKFNFVDTRTRFSDLNGGDYFVIHGHGSTHVIRKLEGLCEDYDGCKVNSINVDNGSLRYIMATTIVIQVYPQAPVEFGLQKPSK